MGNFFTSVIRFVITFKFLPLAYVTYDVLMNFKDFFGTKLIKAYLTFTI